MAVTFVLIADKIQKVPSAARLLDQSQRVLQDRSSVQQPRLPEGRPTAARVLDHALHIITAFLCLCCSQLSLLTNMCIRVSTPLRYLVTPCLLKASVDVWKELGWRELERVAAFPGLTDANTEPRLYIPGGGITKGLYTDRYRESSFSLLAAS